MKTQQDSVDPSAEVACETELAMKATDSAELWHRQMGHINPKSLDILKKAEANGVEFDDTVSSCDICAMEKSKQLAPPPKKTIHEVNAPFQLIYADLMGPISPAALGGFSYTSKITD